MDAQELRRSEAGVTGWPGTSVVEIRVKIPSEKQSAGEKKGPRGPLFDFRAGLKCQRSSTAPCMFS